LHVQLKQAHDTIALLQQQAEDNSIMSVEHASLEMDALRSENETLKLLFIAQKQHRRQM